MTESVSKRIRKQIIQTSHISGHGHIPTCFSVIELMLSAYKVMKHDPANPSWNGRDIFILSKGHAALGHYSVLEEMGYFPAEQLKTFGSFKSALGCHADRFKVPGVEVSTGSLGHGISVAVGIALAFKISKSARRVFCIFGDGESNEGTVWESIMVASHMKLNNLVLMLDNNNSQIRCLPITDPAEKFRSFGCEVDVVNGHDINILTEKLSGQNMSNVKVIVANTIKGYGCKTLVENMFAWHRRSPNQEEMIQLFKELDEAAI